MSWHSDVEYVATTLLTHDQVLRYLALRRARLIGMLWSDSGHYFLAPLGVDRRDCADPISKIRLMSLIETLECPRKAVQSEVADDEQEDVCAA